MANTEKEIQKTIEEMNKRVREFKPNNNKWTYSLNLRYFKDFFFSFKGQLALAIFGVIAVILFFIFVIFNHSDSVTKAKITTEEEKKLLEMVPGYKTSID